MSSYAGRGKWIFAIRLRAASATAFSQAAVSAHCGAWLKVKHKVFDCSCELNLDTLQYSLLNGVTLIIKMLGFFKIKTLNVSNLTPVSWWQ